ncbi:unnamed protein product [Nezara viridula]|uniref:Uncharacterized protein n=1 Tax=Nezara viridula TaxID=85310 RepID=A0A9P0H1J6_NEZVI|nr:unnamed protein product [Nezara viridula]
MTCQHCQRPGFGPTAIICASIAIVSSAGTRRPVGVVLVSAPRALKVSRSTTRGCLSQHPLPHWLRDKRADWAADKSFTFPPTPPTDAAPEAPPPDWGSHQLGMFIHPQEHAPAPQQQCDVKPMLGGQQKPREGPVGSYVGYHQDYHYNSYGLMFHEKQGSQPSASPQPQGSQQNRTKSRTSAGRESLFVPNRERGFATPQK